MPPSTPRPKLRPGFVAAVIMMWVGLLAGGMLLLNALAAEPGKTASAPEEWPQDSAIPRVPGTPTLVMFVHPKCACTRASLSELNILLNDPGVHGTAVVAFLRPPDVDDEWSHTSTWTTAGGLPHAHRFVDGDGMEAARFGARTSGHVLVYTADGKLAYSGGVTGARGHAGDNTGRDLALAAFTRTARGAGHDTYGCALTDGER